MSSRDTVVPRSPAPSRQNGTSGWFANLVASPSFQSKAARIPLLRRIVRREGEAIFDVLAGFCQTQTTVALIELGLLDKLSDGAAGLSELKRQSEVDEERLTILLRAGAAIGLVRKRRDQWRLTTRGAALTGVPGLMEMIRHNAILYRDLADPAAFFRGEVEAEMATFWPYVFGADAATDPAQAARYSQIMSESQALVAAEVLSSVSFSQSRLLLDVGGGTGAFLEAVGEDYPRLKRALFDLPAVMDEAQKRFAGGTVGLYRGSFREDSLPEGADTISLIRILFDHRDDTALSLLRKAYDALPEDGRLIIAEPMSLTDAPSVAADAYYALYTLAMGTGRTRTVDEVMALCRAAGFRDLNAPKVSRPFITRIVTARR